MKTFKEHTDDIIESVDALTEKTSYVQKMSPRLSGDAKQADILKGYDKQKKRIDMYMKTIHNSLSMYDRDKKSLSWGDVSTLEKVAYELKELVSFMTGK